MKKQHFKRFLDLRWPDRLFLLRTAASIPLYRLALKTLGYAGFKARFLLPRKSEESTISFEHAREFGRLVNMAVGVSAGPDNCLLRSVMLARFLIRRGAAAEIKFGVNKEDAHFRAHSWVELGGRPVNDSDDVAEHHHVFSAPQT